MRRIIERVLTVVTTTTWKISWEADPDLSQPTADPASEELPHLEILSESQTLGPTVLGTKEVNRSETQDIPNLPAEGLPEDPNSYLLKKGNEKS